jgi:hypothetical protein
MIKIQFPDGNIKAFQKGVLALMRLQKVFHKV